MNKQLITILLLFLSAEMNFSTQVFNNMGGKVFVQLKYQDLLKCRNVCVQWKNVLDDPFLWLKILKRNGLSEQSHKCWVNLITRSAENGIHRETFLMPLVKMLALYEQSNRPNSVKEWELANPPIYSAIRFGCLEVVKAIANLNTGFFNPIQHYVLGKHWNLFIEALKNGHLEIAKFIVDKVRQKSLDMNNKSILGNLGEKYVHEQLLFQKIKYNHKDVVKYLASFIKNPLKCHQEDGLTPLLVAAKYGHIDLVEFFADMTNDIDIDAIIQTMENIENSCGHLMLQPNADKVLQCLIKKDPNGATPLHIAAKLGFMKVCKMFPQYINVEDINGETPIYYAVNTEKLLSFPVFRTLQQKIDVFKYLISLLYNKPNNINSRNQTPLHYFIAHSTQSYYSDQLQVRILSLLTDSAHNLSVQDSQGWTPLHYAVSHYDQDLFKEIVLRIDPMSSVNIMDEEGLKPLDLALEDCNIEAVKTLAPLTEDLTISEETRNHPGYQGNEKFEMCLQIIDQHRKERENM